MPVVKFFARLDLGQICLFLDRHELWPVFASLILESNLAVGSLGYLREQPRNRASHRIIR